jgi:hypothetical protein
VAIAEIDGYVTDPSGQAIAGAQVKATEVDKGQVRDTVSETSGRYALPDLPVGNYKLEVSAKGFKTYVQTGIILQVASNVTLNVPMQIGAVTESIRVEANAAMVETKENAVAQVIDTERMVDLPLNGRNPTQLLTLTGAGTTNMTVNGGDLTGNKNIQGTAGASGQFSVAGSQANGINFLLDGGDNNDAFSNVGLPIPMPDAVAEFNVLVNGLQPQYGLHPGGVVNVVTNSGANAFHGDLFEFLRNGDLNGRQAGVATVSSTGVFSNSLQPARDSLKRNQFGGTAGGRIIKDKLFFFGGYQGTRQRSDPATRTAYVPTQAVLNGDFSVVDSTACLTKAKQLKDPSGNAYPNNQIPQSQFDPAAVKLLTSYIPKSTDPCGSYLYAFPGNNPDDQWIGRIDYILNDKHSLYGRYFVYDYLAQSLFDGSNALTTGQPGNKQRTQNLTIGDTYTLSPTEVNSFHATANRRRNNRGDAADYFSPDTLGVTNFWEAIPNYTQLTMTGYSGGGFAIGCGTCAPATFDLNTFQLSDDFTWIKGRHQFAFGFDGRMSQFNSVNDQQADGQFTFNGGITGDGMADVLIGRFNGAPGLTDGKVISDYLRLKVVAGYAQDAFHATPRITINFGLRWEPTVPAYDKYGRGNQFNWSLFEQGWHSSVYPTAPAGLVFYGDSQDAYGKAFTASHWNTVSPRVGIVWDPNGTGKQTLRGAFTLIHDTNELFYPERWTTNSPYVSSLQITTGQFSNPFGTAGDPFPGVNVFPSIGGTGNAPGAYVSVPPNISPMYVMQWNISYQRQFGTDWRITSTYMGNATRHLLGSVDVNQALDVPVPGTGAAASTKNTNNRRPTYLMNQTTGGYYGDIQVSDDSNNGEYHALLVSVLHRMANNFTVLSNYTWSHCVGDWDFAGELAGPVYQNSLGGHEGERGSCGFDHRQVFNISLVYNSPGLGHGALKAVSKGWQIGAISSVASGYPIQLTDGGVDVSLSGQGLDRPEVILPSQVYLKQKTGSYYDWFNPAAFANAPAGQFGDLGRNSIYGPGVISFDTDLVRRFQYHERYRLEFRADFFNVLNHPNPGNPVATNTSSTFGDITGFGGTSPRQIQMSLKLFF